MDTFHLWRFINGNINHVETEAKADPSENTSGPLMGPEQYVRPKTVQTI
jgi:hypothetical protein